MGYAKLTFTTSVSSSQLLSDIFKVVTGNITSASQLEFCQTASSEVVNTLGQNWIPVVDTPLEKALREPCVVSSKDKYVILRSVTGSSNTATGSNALIAGTSNASGIIMNGASFVTSGSSTVVATNQTYYNTNTTAALLNAARFGTNVNLDTQIHLSWSDRHLLIYGGVQGSSATMMHACLEFQENNLTTYNNSPPFMMVKSSMLATGLTTLSGPGSDATSLSSLSTVNQFRPSYTGPTTVGTYAMTTTSGSGTLYPTLNTLASSMATSINSENQAASYFAPLWWAEPIAGIPIMNCSTLTNIFVTTANIGTTGDTVTVGPYTYVVLMLGTTMYGGTKYSAVMVPRF